MSELDQLLISAIHCLRRGGVVAHACEGVWGLACDPWNELVVERVLSIKQRSVDQGLILIAHEHSYFSSELSKLSESQRSRITASWPGHITWLLPTMRFPTWITGVHETVAVRVPDHEQARLLCEGFGGALVSTSANVANEPAATTEDEVKNCIGNLVDLILPGSTSGATSASKIFTIDGESVR